MPSRGRNQGVISGTKNVCENQVNGTKSRERERGEVADSNSTIEVPLKEFLQELYDDRAELSELNEEICLARPLPSGRGWEQVAATPETIRHIEENPDAWYVGVSTVTAARGRKVRRRKQDCRSVYVVMLDDIGTKAVAPMLDPSAILETSAGNFQWLYFLEPYDVTDERNRQHFDACMNAIINAGYCDAGAKGISRVFRVPGSINTKKGKENWQTRVTEWAPGRVGELGELMKALDLKPDWDGVREPRHPMTA